MPQENIQIAQYNFCIAPVVGTFATVDTTNTTARLIIKNSTGVATVSYTFNPNLSQNTNIYYLDYIGPRNLSALKSGMVFITMESNLTSLVTIKKWDLDVENTRLNLDYTISKNSAGYDTFACRAMAIGRYYTSLSLTTVTGTGSIVLNNVDNVVSGTRLYIGPSSNTTYLGNYEEVIATSISGTTVSISSTNGIPLSSYFNSGDPITYLGNIYLFSDMGYAANQTMGCLFTLDNYTGDIKDRHNSALYNNVKASNYGLPYSNTVALVKNSQLLYIDVNDYAISKSARINNTKYLSSEVVDVFALSFTESTIYRLQDKKIIRSDTGEYNTLNWSSYNYHEDTSNRYPDCISLSTDNITLYNQETILIRVAVLDQYGMGISGKTVKFEKIYGDSAGTWGEVNSEAITDINGIGFITYTSGWYNASFISPANEDVKIVAHTDGSNVLTGSIYIWTSMILKLNAKFLLDRLDIAGYGVPLITQKIDSKNISTSLKQLPLFTSSFILRSLTKFKMPGGHEIFDNFALVAIVKQLQNFEGDLEFIQKSSFNGSSSFKQTIDKKGEFAVSQTVVSKHLPVGSNTDNVFIAQFKFLIDAIPVPFSEKNNVNATIWLRLAPYGFNLNKDTLVFKVREVSYAGDTGFINYEGTSFLQVTEFDAGGGLVGLEVLYIPLEYFHNDAIVYVYLEVYDSALPPNRIEFDYWFTIVPDYKAPYIINEYPKRDDQDVLIDTNISFDIIDNEVGVDISSLELYVNNRIKIFTYGSIDNGFHITFFNEGQFYYEQIIEIAIFVIDTSGQKNTLYDMWRFKIASSSAPIVDSESFYPPTCVRGIKTRTTKMYFNVLDEGNGIDVSSIELIAEGKIRDYKVTPIIKRII